MLATNKNFASPACGAAFGPAGNSRHGNRRPACIQCSNPLSVVFAATFSVYQLANVYIDPVAGSLHATLTGSASPTN